MGHDGQSTGLVNQLDGLESGHLEFRHPRRFALLEKTLERFVQTAGQLLLHKSTRDVRAPGRLTIRERKDRLRLQRHSDMLQALGHLMDASLAHMLKTREFGAESLVGRIEEVADEVQLHIAKFGCQLAGGNKFDATFRAGGSGAFTSGATDPGPADDSPIVAETIDAANWRPAAQRADNGSDDADLVETEVAMDAGSVAPVAHVTEFSRSRPDDEDPSSGDS